MALGFGVSPYVPYLLPAVAMFPELEEFFLRLGDLLPDSKIKRMEEALHKTNRNLAVLLEAPASHSDPSQ